jgi:hypothetical protein
MSSSLSRRQFLEAASLAGVSLSSSFPILATAADRGAVALNLSAGEKPAVLGGKPVFEGKFPAWPVFDQTEEKALLEALRSGHWFRGSGKTVAQFEEAYAKLTGAKYCLATSCGTSALYTVLGALEVGPGDEVILPPYTFVATYNVIVLNYALPIFVDSDLDTQIKLKRRSPIAHARSSPCISAAPQQIWTKFSPSPTGGNWRWLKMRASRTWLSGVDAKWAPGAPPAVSASRPARISTPAKAGPS